MNSRFTIETYSSAIFDVLLAHGRNVVLTQRGFSILLEQNPPCASPISILPRIVKNTKDPLYCSCVLLMEL